MRYEGNPKHKEPWQRGRKGSLCPRAITVEKAQELLEGSEAVGSARFATCDGRAYKGFENPGSGDWHGFPVGWVEVPDGLRRRWKREGRVRSEEIRKYWNE